MKNKNSSKQTTKAVTVIELADRHDDYFMLETIVKVASSGGAHVYAVPDPPLGGFDWYGEMFVVSDRPLNETEIKAAYHEEQEELAREALKGGMSPDEVFDIFDVCAVFVSQACKQEGVPISPNWLETVRASIQ